MSIGRELGPLPAAIWVAGRAGAVTTPRLGSLRMTEECDAMAGMGMPPCSRLIVPKLLARAIAMRRLVIWPDAMTGEITN